jgi:hypothetical protein
MKCECYPLHYEINVGILKTIRELMNPPAASKRSIGFAELQDDCMDAEGRVTLGAVTERKK